MTELVDEYLQRVRDDPGLRAVLRTARAWGVSPGRFLGREPARAYTVERDDLGRVARVVEHTDPEWDDEGRRLALALAMYEADLCSGCGLPRYETNDPANEFRYVPMQAVRCHACTALEVGSKPYAGSPQPSALYIPVELMPTVEPAHA